MVIGIFILFVGLFILGMSMLRYGLFHLSGESLKIWLTKTTDVPWKGFLAGILITCLLQSSSAVMIITIGLISVKNAHIPSIHWNHSRYKHWYHDYNGINYI